MLDITSYFLVFIELETGRDNEADLWPVPIDLTSSGRSFSIPRSFDDSSYAVNSSSKHEYDSDSSDSSDSSD